MQLIEKFLSFLNMAFCKPVVLKSIENLRGKLFNKVAKVLEVLGFVFVNTDECS